MGMATAYMALRFLNCLFHGAGFFILLNVYKKNCRSTQNQRGSQIQTIWILNLSLSEFIHNIARLAVSILEWYLAASFHPPSIVHPHHPTPTGLPALPGSTGFPTQNDSLPTSTFSTFTSLLSALNTGIVY